MAESGACLMRSFTHPSNSLRESQEFQGDTLRALTESVSFGRFMSESLAWEKWSTFSHNRYLEEVEQFSKPGSVAQKKAFFEAHYKKRAAMKAAAAGTLVEQPNGAVESEGEAATEPVASPAAASDGELNSDCMKDGTNSVSVDDVVMAFEEQQHCGNDSEETGSFGNENAIMDNSTIVEEEEDELMFITKPELELSPKQMENGDEMKAVTPIIKEAAAEQEEVDLQSNKRRKSSASSLSSKSGTTTTTTARLSNSKSAAKQKASSSSQTKVGLKKTVGVEEESSIEKKRIAPKAIHMSINFASKLWETGKSSLMKSRELAAAPKIAATKASVRQGESKLRASSVMATRQQDDRSSCSKSSGTSGSKSRPPLISSPFSFRSEERAARRREIVEERNKIEAEKLQLQARSKEKKELYMKSLRQSSTAAFRTRPIEDSASGSQSSITSHTRKSQIPLTRPRSPKLGRKTSPGTSVTTESSSKLVTPKNRQSTNRSSVRMLPKRKTHENASPNIQL